MNNPASNTNPMENMLNNMKNMKEENVVRALMAIIIIVIVALVVFYYRIFTLEERSCKQLKTLYPKMNGHIKSINNSEDFKYMFRDYYIKTAANCCSTGDYESAMVSTCALRDVIKQGVRGLDFEIYSINNEPSIATSTIDKYTVKEVYNRVLFKDAIGIIKNYAFSQGSCPNPEDPIIIHIRFKSKNQKMYEEMAKILYENEDKLLGCQYNFQMNYRNFGEVPLLALQRKIIIAVNNQDKTYITVKDFAKYVNIASGTQFMRLYTNDQIRNVHSMAEQIKYDKKNMTIVIPDPSAKPINPSGFACRKMGIQLIGMAYQKQDTSFLEMEEFFNKNNTAFVLKPPELRFFQKYIPKPKKQDKRLSFASKPAQAQGLPFSM
jgi:hypothetical protein